MHIWGHTAGYNHRCNTFAIKINGFGVKGVSGGLDLCRFPAKLANFSDMSAEVHAQAQIFPIFCSQVGFRSKLTHGTKKKGGKIFAPKDLVRGPVC